MNISILHLSDLHIMNVNGTYSDILGHLIDDIKEQCSELKHIILVITGDIIDKSNYSKENVKIVLDFFMKLQSAIGDKIVGVEITPGNHDKEMHNINMQLVEEKRKIKEICNIEKT